MVNANRGVRRLSARTQCAASRSGVKPIGMIATRRPPGANRFAAPMRCLAAMCLSRERSTEDANGGFITITLGAVVDISRSSICSASCPIACASNTTSSSRWRNGSTSLSMSLAPARLAKPANEPVPAEGSNTVSPLRIAAARTARAA